MSSRPRRLLVLSLPMMFAAASIAIGAAALAKSSPMRVTGMTPTTGFPGTVITISGEDFGSTQGSKLVGMNLGRVNLMEVRYWSNNKIQVVVPNLPVGEYTVVVYFDNSYRTYAGWSSSPRFRVVPRDIPRTDPPTPSPRPPFPPLAACKPVAKAANLLCNPDLDIVGPLGAETSRHMATGGGAGDSAAKIWWLFVNGTGRIKTALETSDRPDATLSSLEPSSRSVSTASSRRAPMMLYVSTGSGASGVLQQFLARDNGPQRVTFSIWVKVKTGRVVVSLGNWGLRTTGGWRAAAKSRGTGRWELLSGCSVFKPDEPLPLNQIFIHSSDDSAAEFYLDFAEVKNADPSWTGTGCTILGS